MAHHESVGRMLRRDRGPAVLYAVSFSQEFCYPFYEICIVVSEQNAWAIRDL